MTWARGGVVAVVVSLAACASAPRVKQPDESHRVPVNRVLPPELEATRPSAARSKASGRADGIAGGEVLWR